MITQQHRNLAVGALRTFPNLANVSEKAQQKAVLSGIVAAGLVAAGEERCITWYGPTWRGRGRMDFVFHAGTSTVASSTPVQFKPLRRSVHDAVRDLFTLGLWWPGFNSLIVRPALWYCSSNANDGPLIVNTAIQWLGAPTTRPAHKDMHMDWGKLLNWAPTPCHVGSWPVQNGVWLHEVTLTGSPGSPAAQFGLPPAPGRLLTRTHP